MFISYTGRWSHSSAFFGNTPMSCWFPGNFALDDLSVFLPFFNSQVKA
ncbi:hypothetical protein ADIS_1993 [Lunatimonas lonarensis]|uniref:Uncharacterized protein n=1 Tax=Lunatimonas lonarensis TaxID=1232681 RepID=R7ZTU7_9BACT|nr:hypothetical protein ADIS_1993 [Lunatimonas lonarensis]